MKIYSGFAQFLCGILFLASFLPMQGQPDSMKNYLQGKFTTYSQNLKDFKNCFIGKKECSSREKAIKTTALTVGALVLLSALLFIIRQGPGMIQARRTIRDIKRYVTQAELDMQKLKPKFRKSFQAVPNIQAEKPEEIEEVLVGIELASPMQQFPHLENRLSTLKEDIAQLESMSSVDMQAYNRALGYIKTELQEIQRIITAVEALLK